MGNNRLDRDSIPSLAEVFKDDFLFGFGGMQSWDVPNRLLSGDPTLTALIRKHARIVTVNSLYPPQLAGKGFQPEWNWKMCDDLVAWAQKNGMKIRFHPLTWLFHREQGLECLLKKPDGSLVDRDTAIGKISDYVHTVLGRYKGVGYAVDVLNEATPRHKGDPEKNGLKPGLWQEVVGPEIVEIVFKAAREADPGIKLFYNEDEMWQADKRPYDLALIQNLKSKGLIDGIGMQQHITMERPTLKELDEEFADFARLGLDIHITELDLNMNPHHNVTRWTDELAQDQARRYRDVFEVYKKYGLKSSLPGKLTAVMPWEILDPQTWLSRYHPGVPNWPLFFDGKMDPKPAFWAIVGGKG